MSTEKNPQASVVAICALLVSLIATAASIANMHSDREAKRLSNLITIDQYLHQVDISAARHAVRDESALRTTFDDNTRRVCSSFDFAGMLVRNRAVDKAIFIEYWNESLVKIDQRLAPFWENPNYTGSGYTLRVQYPSFYWLVQQAKKTKPKQ